MYLFKFNRWSMLYVEGTELKLNSKSKVICQCDCGTIKSVSFGGIRTDTSKSCGCLHSERTSARFKTHGQSNSPTYNSWRGMIERCSNPNHIGYSKYGERGIKICERWRVFENFLADMGERPNGLTLDRINNNGNYEPGNCRWATNDEQQNNKRNNLTLTYQGETKTVSEWAKEKNMKYKTILNRVQNLGWSVEKALTTSDDLKRYVTYQGETKTVSEWAKEKNMKYTTLKNRLNNLNWSVEKALTTPLKGN